MQSRLPVDSSPGALEEAVGRAPEGATLVLGTAEYTLHRPLLLERAITIEGPGPVTFQGVGPAIVASAANGPVILRGMTIQQKPRSQSPVVVARAGDVTLERCVVLGGATAAPPGAMGMEIDGDLALALKNGELGSREEIFRRVREAGSGVLAHEQCRFIRLCGCILRWHSEAGVVILDESQFEVVDTKSEQNAAWGALIADETRGTVTRSVFERNFGTGLCIMGKSRLDVTHSKFIENLGAGLTAETDRLTNLEGNVATGNGQDGFELQAAAACLIHKNTVTENALSGLRVFLSTAEIVNNRCEGNEADGISLVEGGTATVRDNQCVDNRFAGIGVYAGVGGRIAGNACRDNWNGIFLERGAQASVASNRLTGNRRSDVLRESALTAVGGLFAARQREPRPQSRLVSRPLGRVS